jgi:diguanylate cyclase (GGDEF)-like protein
LLAPVGAAAAAGYLLHCGRIGIAGARRLAPAATIFALVTAAAAANVLGLLGANVVAPFAIGGFSAAGALLVALATSVPIEPAMERLREFEKLHKHDDEQSAVTDESLDQMRELAAVAASHQGVFDLDMETGLVSLSAEGAAILGLPTGAVELSKETWLGRIHPDDREIYEQALDTYRHQPGVAFRLEFRARAAGSRTAWLELRATMTGQSTEAERCLGLIADVTARKSGETAGLHPEHRDALTGLGNRLALIAQLEDLHHDFETIALAVFDLDRFKAVNDSLGRERGDALLSSFAERLEQGFETEHSTGRVTIFRVGGDMFAVLCRRIADLTDFGERIVDMASVPFIVGEREIYLPTSVGVAAGAKAEDAQELISQAELAMVEAKREGGERVCVYSSALAEFAPRDPVALESDLRRALERDEFEVHYQPIIRLKDASVAGFEALLRWRHPERGFIEPVSFVPQAERSGLIVPLGRFVLKRAAEDLARWQQFFPSKPPLFLDVNVTWRQIADRGFASELEALLKSSHIAKRTLRLEVTESAVMAGADKAEAALNRLKTLGAGLAIDDFGTGHSSLSHLRRFPFDVIKIDKSFVAAAHEKAGAAILASIVSLAHELERPAVAEGVEKGSEATLLREMGCEYGQGYFFGAPMPASEIIGYISTAIAR